MKRFRFKFQALLNVEQHKEDAVRQELRTALYHLHQEEETLLNLKTIFHAQQEELAEKQLGKISTGELRLYEAYISAIYTQITTQEARVKEHEAFVDEVRQKLIEVSKRRKILEKLRAKKKQEHEYLFRQFENKQLDEIAVTRFNHIN